MTQTTALYSLNYNDSNYRNAINYDGTHYYNNPITITINNILFILSCGTSDHISVKVDGNIVSIIGENKGLDYISMSVIDLSDNSLESCYLSSNDINCAENQCYGIFDKELDEQINILNLYLPY